MTSTLSPPRPPDLDRSTTDRPDLQPWRKRPLWNRFTPWQLVVMALAAIAPLTISGAIAARLAGALSTEAMIELALAAGENPGMITFGAMFLATPVQWLTGRTQVRVRKYFGIVFYLLALSNGAMFAIESGVDQALSEPLLVAGSAALAAAFPLFITSSRWSQRALGMPRWRLLHKLTYAVAFALVAHVVLIGDIGLGFVLIMSGFIARVPSIRLRLQRRGSSR